jgi:hypothetical protein
MNNYNNDNSTNESSVFNEASFQINRLHNAWLNCKRYRTTGNFFDWRWELENVWSELYCDAVRLDKDKDKEDCIIFSICAIDKLINQKRKE